jgi:hypothetical protein
MEMIGMTLIARASSQAPKQVAEGMTLGNHPASMPNRESSDSSQANRSRLNRPVRDALVVSVA